MSAMTKKSIAVIGGDDREIILVQSLAERGYSIKVFGFPGSVDSSLVQVCPSFQESVQDVRAIILPMPGINNRGVLYAKYASSEICITAEDFAGVSPGVPVFVGTASPYLKNIAQSKGFPLIEVADLDEIAIPNSVPSAEGAIQIAMEKLPITIHHSQSFVIGYGRVAETLCAMLKGIGAIVTVVARNPSQLAKCRVLGYQAEHLTDLPFCIHRADVIFNTVPALVIDEQVLQYVKKDAWIIDLATSPGGTDFVAAEKLGINAMLAPGLPGKVAPLTAGRIMAEAYPGIIESQILKLAK